ncbi:hypothetical protein BDZ94DRAFT_1262286 [Collybia nuda]|uniref:Uncharacterized protein n=1 Tax=Collybia nuda TaxID=64659 RepID=A0A9P5Y278_9AGAR|nr:hypothetical protein BDZ94DRAFT_1262286 [Collybia nuda]
MYIASPIRERDEDTKAFIRNRRRSSIQPVNLAPAESLMSLDTNSQEIVERLLQPGMFDDDTDNDGDAGEKKEKTKVVQWQATILNTPAKPKYRVKMPGALSSPSPDASMDSTKGSKNAGTPEHSSSTIILSESGTSANTTPRRPQPLIRSMSIEQREAFVSGLNAASHATVYIVPSADVRSVQAFAIKLGFYAKSIVSSNDEDHEAFKVEKESKKPSNAPAGRLRAAAGGAVVGAVGAWAGLAFS